MAFGSKPTDIAALKSLSATRYEGKPCILHPELKGERRKCNYQCVGCWRMARAKYNNKPGPRAKLLEIKRSGRESELIARRIARKIDNEIRMIAIRMAWEMFTDRAKWRACWLQAKEEYEKSLQSPA